MAGIWYDTSKNFLARRVETQVSGYVEKSEQSILHEDGCCLVCTSRSAFRRTASHRERSGAFRVAGDRTVGDVNARVLINSNLAYVSQDLVSTTHASQNITLHLDIWLNMNPA